MNLRIWKVILAVTMGVVLTISAGWNVAATPYRDYELQGTWLVTVTQQICNGGPVVSKFPSILTFTGGGAVVEDTSNPAFEPGQRGVGQGAWWYEGKHSFGAKTVALIRPPQTPYKVGAPLFRAGTQIIAQTIQFEPGKPDAWSSQAQVEFLDATGASYSPSPVQPPPCMDITATAVRFE